MPENRDKTKYSVFLIISHSYHNLNVTAIQQQQNNILKLESIDRCSRWDHVFTESIQPARGERRAPPGLLCSCRRPGRFRGPRLALQPVRAQLPAHGRGQQGGPGRRGATPGGSAGRLPGRVKEVAENEEAPRARRLRPPRRRESEEELGAPR